MFARNPCNLRGIRVYLTNLQAPKIGNFGENLLKVSSLKCRYSRFWGDFQRRQISIRLSGRVGSEIWRPRQAWPQNSPIISGHLKLGFCCSSGSEIGLLLLASGSGRVLNHAPSCLLMSAVEAEADVFIGSHDFCLWRPEAALRSE